MWKNIWVVFWSIIIRLSYWNDEMTSLLGPLKNCPADCTDFRKFLIQLKYTNTALRLDFLVVNYEFLFKRDTHTVFVESYILYILGSIFCHFFKNKSSLFSHFLEFSAFPVCGKTSPYHCSIKVDSLKRASSVCLGDSFEI